MQVLIADDHKLVRDGIVPMLALLDSGVDILEASTLDEALTCVSRASKLKLVLLDLVMPGMNSFSGLNTMISQCPGVPVVVLSGYSSRDHIITAMRHGASGFIPKTVSGSTLVSALRLILNGEKYLPSSCLLDAPEHTTSKSSYAANEQIASLTGREVEVLTLTVRGLTNRDIAKNLGIREITVKVHLRNVYRKIGVRNRAQAVRFAMTSGFDGEDRLI